MARLVVRYRKQEQIYWGELRSDAPLSGEADITVAQIKVTADTTRDFLATTSGKVLDLGAPEMVRATDLLSPITADASIFCQGLNYQSHAEESSHSSRKSNLIFAKASSSISGPYDDIIRPAEVELLDYEVEIGVVVKRDIGADETITQRELGSAIAGIVLCNDVSARDTMFGESFLQWFRGKSYRTFCPTGPVLVLLDEGEVASALEALEIRLWVNGELRQQASSDQLIYGPAETLTYIAKSMDLRRGDLLLTGTPGGVAAVATPQVVQILKEHLLADEVRREKLRHELSRGKPFLQPGDVVTATLTMSGDAIGGLANRIVDAPARA